MIKLQSNDGQVFEVERHTISSSITIASMLDDLGAEVEGAIPLQNITGAILARVIAYANYHDKENLTKEEVEKWDEEFCNVPHAELFDIILAANYLDMKPLLEMTCKVVANMIKGKTREEIRAHFNVTHEFTPEEEEQIRRENQWCENQLPEG